MPGPSRKRARLTELSYSDKQIEDYVVGEAYDHTRHERCPNVANAHPSFAAAKRMVFAGMIELHKTLVPYAENDGQISHLAQNAREHAPSVKSMPIKFAIVGQTGVGKSSLLNNIAGIRIAKHGATGDICTQVAQVFGSSAAGTSVYSSRIHFLSDADVCSRFKKLLQAIRVHANLDPGESDDKAEVDVLRWDSDDAQESLSTLFAELGVFGFLSNRKDAEKHLQGKDDKFIENLAKQMVKSSHGVIQQSKVNHVEDAPTETFLEAASLENLQVLLEPFTQGICTQLVDTIHTNIPSGLLYNGAVLGDTPGTEQRNDELPATNNHFVSSCGSVIVVADGACIVEDRSLEELIKKYIRQKGLRNVCLVVTKKDLIHGKNAKFTQDEKRKEEEATLTWNHAEAFLRLKEKYKASHAEIERQNQLVESTRLNLDRIRIHANCRILTERMQTICRNRRRDGDEQLTVIPVSNQAMEAHISGRHRGEHVLNAEETGIPAVRAWISRASGMADVERMSDQIRQCSIILSKAQAWCDQPEHLDESHNNREMPIEMRDVAVPLIQAAVETARTMLTEAQEEVEKSKEWA